MKILYVSVHGVLEQQELQLLTDLGHECFSVGEYINPIVPPEQAYLHKRPGINGMQPHPDLEKFAIENPSTNIAQELIDWCDIVMVMHDPNVIVMNWDKFKQSGKKIVWRSIGQSTAHVENQLRRMRYDGMKIIRMSHQEQNIPGYMGEDVTIRFNFDPNDLGNWNGDVKRAMNTTQSLLGRRAFCHYDAIIKMMDGFPSLIYGSGNSDLGALNGGELPYDLLKGALRDNRVFCYSGTWPSPYTLSVIEAMGTGIPVVAIGKHLAEDLPEIAMQDRIEYYEMPLLIDNGRNGFISDDINELRDDIHQLLEDEELAQKIGEQGRKTAIKYWNKENIKTGWEDFLATL